METQPKIVLLCGGPFSYRSLSSLAYTNFLAGVVIGTSDYHISTSLKMECEKSQVPFLCIEEKNEVNKLDEWLTALNPDAVFSICFPFLISKKTLSNDTIKFINFHTGPLPSYRGPMPIFEVLRNQEKETAMSVHWMSEKYDKGDLIYAEHISINEDDNYTSLALKLSERCGIMALNLAEMLQFGSSIPSQKQERLNAQFHSFPKRSELIIDWKRMNAEEIIALIKACNGWNNGAITNFNNEEIHLIDVKPIPEVLEINHTPGTLIQLNEDGSGEIACIEYKKIRINQFGNENGFFSFDYLLQTGIISGVRFE